MTDGTAQPREPKERPEPRHLPWWYDEPPPPPLREDHRGDGRGGR